MDLDNISMTKSLTLDIYMDQQKCLKKAKSRLERLRNQDLMLEVNIFNNVFLEDRKIIKYGVTQK